MNNERIKELADQCWNESYTGAVREVNKWSKEKFAELIIEECKQAMETAWYATGQDINGGSIKEFSAEFNKQIGVK